MTVRVFSGDELVVASHNKGKLKELGVMLGDRVAKISTAADYNLDSPPETGTTFAENAALKARYVAAKTGKIAMADDSGICIDGLDGAPGVYTADWAERPDGSRDFVFAMNLVEEKLREKWGDAYPRGARFVCCLTLAWPDGHIEQVEGTVEGSIAFPMRGDTGFGYDPVFVAKDYPDVTFAEMDPALKNRISHRAQALRALLEKYF